MSEETLIVTADIPFGSVYAYRVGDHITKAAVEENGWQDYVATEKAAAKAAAADAAKKES